MKLSSSFISSSEESASVAGSARLLAYVVGWLIVLDVVINVVFAPPTDPRIEPNSLQRYFEYGRSVEGKLHALVGPSDESTGPVALAGWLDDPLPIPESPGAAPGRTLVVGYGQSFTGNLLGALSEVDPEFETRVLGGPAAPPSHSLWLYRKDREHHDARVVVMGVLASSLPRLASLTNMTTDFEVPQPATYPRLRIVNGRLEAIEPRVASIGAMRAALADPAEWNAFAEQLRTHDAGYVGSIFDRDLLDHSALARVVRRGLGQRRMQQYRARFLRRGRFTNHLGTVDVAAAIVTEFARDVRRRGGIPYVFLINDRGYGDALHHALGPILDRDGVAYLSSHELAPPEGAGIFMPDGHFNPEVRARMAKAVAADLRRLLQIRQ